MAIFSVGYSALQEGLAGYDFILEGDEASQVGAIEARPASRSPSGP